MSIFPRFCSYSILSVGFYLCKQMIMWHILLVDLVPKEKWLHAEETPDRYESVCKV